MRIASLVVVMLSSMNKISVCGICDTTASVVEMSHVSSSEAAVDPMETIERATSSVEENDKSSLLSLQSFKGSLVVEESGSSSCAAPLLRWGYPMGNCLVDTTAQESYFFACESNATTTSRVRYRCSSDLTCGSCDGGTVVETFGRNTCTFYGKQYWTYYAGAECTTDERPYDSYTDGWLIKRYETASCNAEDEDTISSWTYYPLRVCAKYLNESSFIYATSCADGQLTYDWYWSRFCLDKRTSNQVDPLPSCDLNGETWETSSCLSDVSDDDFCFHVDTIINYKGVEYTFSELKAGKEAECSVPHSPHSRGVIISTSCGKTLRVTDTHLVATSKGFQLAFSLKKDDALYSDYNDDETCVVITVEKEVATQQYFGLNCVHSEVLASGLRTSLFGDFHVLPSWYMSYVGSFIGFKAASYLGEYVAEWYFLN